MGMKNRNNVCSVIALCLLLAVSGCVRYAAHAGGKVIPVKLDIPADFKVTRSDWVDEERASVGWPLGDRSLRGKTIREINGLFPVHIMLADLPEFEGAPLRKDDLLVGIDGVALGKDGVDQMCNAVSHALKKGKPVNVTRWRSGVIETFPLDFRLRQKGFSVPDLTNGGMPDETRDWTLGPIGANGWGFSLNTAKGASAKARQLLITLVDDRGPSAGRLAVGDVIVGVDGQKFEIDARKALAQAIDEAEKEENAGRLKLLVWRPLKPGQGGAKGPSTDSTSSPQAGLRAGKQMEVAITLPVLGSYSETAPFDCPKTEKIIGNAVEYMKQNKEDLLKPDDWLSYINGLGLLAAGREDVMPLVKELAHGSLLQEGETLSIEKHVSMMCWKWSYKTVFLCEYYLKTKDEAVLPTINEYATKIAMGQSGAGTWGHTYAAIENTGRLHGHLGGYGAINQQGLTLMIALPLAVKCGVNNQEVLDAIKRGNDFFGYFIGKGTIPYGDHGAQPWYDDNGKSGSAAIYFDLMGNDAGRKFFSEMILGSAPGGREQGHTGHFWSHLWGGVGAARGGDKCLQVFMDEMNPIFTLERQYNGRFAYQDNVGERGDRGKAKDKWDCTGARLLQLCVPRRELYITGRETPRDTHLTGTRIDQILDAGRLEVDKEARSKLSLPEIMKLLEDPLPPARTMAVKTLEEREVNCVDQLVTMLDSSNRFARYGAAEALGRVGFADPEAAARLIRLIETDTDTQFRVCAVNALTSTDLRLGLLSVSKPAIPVLLKIATARVEDDPRRVLQLEVARALFYDGRAEPRRGLLPTYGIDGVDRGLLVAAIKDILTNKNGWARSTVAHSIYPLLNENELSQIWGDIYKSTRYKAPSGIMFAGGVRVSGMKVMGEHRVKEAMDLAAWFVRWEKGHGRTGGLEAALKAIESYGAHAKPLIPYLEEHAEYYKALRTPGREIGPDDKASQILATIEKIRNSEAMPELISIADQIDKDDIPPKGGP